MALTSLATLHPSATTGDAANVWIAQKTYRLAENRLIVGRHAAKYQLPQRNALSMRIVRHSRLALPTGVLTEGSPPTAVALAVETVDVTLEQWGIVVQLTDVVQITTKHPALNVAVTRTALAMAEVLEREQCVMLLAGTSVVYPGTVTTRPTIGSADHIDTAAVLKATTQLRTNGAMDSDGLFKGVLSPAQEGDLLGSDQSFKDAHSLINVKALQFAVIGDWMGVRWSRGNFMPIFAGVAAPTGAAATATKAQAAANATPSDGTFAGLSPKIVVVARDISSDYERKISQTSAAITIVAVDDNVDVTLPSSSNYTYDVYCDGGAAGTMTLFSARNAASAVVSVTGKGSGAVAPAAPASGREVFIAWIFGDDAFGRVELDGMSLQSYLTPAGASFSNPLAQSRKVGSKIMWKSFIIDNDYFVRLESSSTYSAQLPS